MPYLNNLKLNSNNYAIGTKINKLNLNGTIYNLGLDTSDATAVPGSLRKNETCYVKGSKVTGILESCDTGTPNQVVGCRNQNGRFEIAVPAGIHGSWWDGGQYCYALYDTVRSAIGLTPEKLVYDEEVLGIRGSKILSSATAFVLTFPGGATVSNTKPNYDIFWGGHLYESAGSDTIRCINRGHHLLLQLNINTQNVSPGCGITVNCYLNGTNVLGKSQASNPELINWNGDHWFTAKIWVNPGDTISITYSSSGQLCFCCQLMGLLESY